jgi:hypothetical protein
VVVVSDAMATRYWPGQDPIGKRLMISKSAGWSTVVGVARDMRYRQLTKGWLTAYFPARQFFFFAPDMLVVRTAGPPEVLLPQIQQAIRATVPEAGIDDVTTMREQSERELSRAADGPDGGRAVRVRGNRPGGRWACTAWWRTTCGNGGRNSRCGRHSAPAPRGFLAT